MKMLYDFVGSFILMFSIIFCWSKLLDSKIKYNSIKFYLVLLILSILSIINYYYMSDFVKIISLTIIFAIFVKILFDIDIKLSILTPIYSQIIIMISEGLCLLLLVTVFDLNTEELKDQFLGTLAMNVLTAVLCILIVSLPIVKKIFKYILSSVNKLSNHFLMFFSMIVIIVANVLAALTYYKIDIRLLIIINISFTLICVAIVFRSFKIQSNYNNVSNKYNIAINSLNDYEAMLTKYRIDNHENKNLLLTIRTMIMNNENNIEEYINSIVKEKYSYSEKLFNKLSIVPSGGLRATIYSEILKIKNHNINYSLDIDRNLKAVTLIELDENTIIDVCKIIGVFIDNSIEEVEKLEEQNIGISLYTENTNLCIKISNNYKGEIYIDKIYNEGYTTKKSGHGYGLALVKKIVNSNNKIENKVELNKNLFSQILVIKYGNLRNV